MYDFVKAYYCDLTEFLCGDQFEEYEVENWGDLTMFCNLLAISI